MPVNPISSTLPARLWAEASGIAQPESFWSGRRVSDGVYVDNLLVFPHLQKLAPRKEHYGNFHPRFVLDTAVNQPVRLHVDGFDYELHSGETMLIFPHQFHDARQGTEPGRWIVVTFDLVGAAEVEALRHSPRQGGMEGLAWLERLVRAYREKAEGVTLSFYATSLLKHLLASPVLPPERVRLPSPEPERDTFLANVQKHLQEEKISTLGELSALMGESESQLRTLFRQHTSGTPGDYIRRHRLARAARMLQRGEGKVTEIAERLGFSSLYAFSRMFKTVYGLSPKQYEKQTQ